MDPSQITDENRLRAWLEGQTREVAVTIAHRAAMRVAPRLWSVVEPCKTPVECHALVFLRAQASISALCAHPTGSLRAIISRSLPPAPESAMYEAQSLQWALLAAWRGDWLQQSVLGIRTAAQHWGVWAAVAADCSKAAAGVSILRAPLWEDSDNPPIEVWRSVAEIWRRDGANWRLWIDWYDAALEGRPLLGDWDRHWALLNEIALIDPEDWDAGPESVNPLIEEKFEKQRLRAEVADLKAKLAEQENTVASVAHRSHNHPPEMVEASLDSLYLVTLDALADAEDELSKASPSPSPSRLNACAAALLDWAGIVVSYSGELGDLIVKGAARKAGASIGLAAGPAALFWTSEQARQVAQALIDFAQRLP